MAHELPKGIGLVWPPSAGADALPIVLTNRGLLFPAGEAPGAPYELRCNEAYGVNTAVVPAVLMDPSNDGVLVMSTSERILRTVDRGCTFESTFEKPGFGTSLGGFVVQASPPGALVLTTVDAEAKSDAGVSQVFASEDYGRTWSWRADSAPAQGYLSMLAAPSNPERLYAVGLRIDSEQGTLKDIFARSDDAGKTWMQRDLASEVLLIGVHPQNPDLLFARERANPQATRWRVVRSSDGGESFSSVMEVAEVSSFAAKPDGSVLWLGVSREGGLYRSTDGGEDFERVHPELVEVDCLTYRDGVLWVCANHAPNLDGIWSIADSSDELVKVLTFERVTAPVACEGAAAEVCRVPWLDWQLEVLRDAGPQNPVADAGVGSDAGMAPGDDAAIIDSGTASSAGGEGGCSVHATAHRRVGHMASFAGLVGLCLAARRRRGKSVGVP